MLGNTNAVIISGGGDINMPVEMVNITVRTNQPTDDDIIGNAKITLKYGEYIEEFIWQNSRITFPVFQYITYTLEFSEIEGYKTPAKLEFTAVKDNTQQLDIVYESEVFIATVKTSNGISVEGQKIEINNVEHTLDATGIVSVKIPYGTTYFVELVDMEGYIKPNAKQYTASQPLRELELYFEEQSYGAFIEDTTGKLWGYYTWDGTATPNGIAVIGENHSFIIALNDLNDTKQGRSLDGSELPFDASEMSPQISMPSGWKSNSSNYLNDIYGYHKTNCYNRSNTPSYADYGCYNFNFPNGRHGYLGGAGEWKMAYDNKSSIDKLMAKVGGTALSGQYWTCTGGGSYPYYVDYSTGVFTTIHYQNRKNVRAFTVPLSKARKTNKLNRKFEVNGYDLDSDISYHTDVLTFTYLPASSTHTISGRDGYYEEQIYYINQYLITNSKNSSGYIDYIQVLYNDISPTEDYLYYYSK